MPIRVGLGFDVHAFSDDPTRRLRLGGVTFDDSPGLAGHSDADVVAHACADALLGAAALGDLGSHFPDTDDRWKDADSIELLGEVSARVRAEGGRRSTSTARSCSRLPGSLPIASRWSSASPPPSARPCR